MQELYVEVYVPAVSKSYDIVIQKNITAAKAAECIANVISEYEGLTISSKDSILCSRDGKRVLTENVGFAECGLRDGSKLMLI